MRILEVDESFIAQVSKGIELMLQSEDITKLCAAFANGHGEQRGVRDVIQGEVSFQEGTQNKLLY